ncbi:MAG TPA: pentapeptide repeat-containing protein [Gemmatimonadaceae bacterium]|nr:pentapeptide repeat-containing protein [Gemmatimonadaceae bacterium]
MSTEIERVVTPTATPQLADVGDRPVARTLAEELKSAGDWRKTSAGAALDLRNVDLSGADLRGVDFTDAVMSGAKLTNANLIGAQFAWAKLEHADFSGATGVVGTQFARADLMGATLPPSVKFGTFDAANDIAQSTGKIFLTMLLVCVYSWLTINSTVDSKLLTDSSTSKLPILNVDIPIVNFYVLVPIALVGVAIVAMLQAQRVWASVAASPSVLPDATAMADRASTWIFGAWAAARVCDQSKIGFLGRAQSWLWIIVGWWIAPATIAWFWMRYLHRHDGGITTVQVIALSLGCGLAAAFLTLASRTLPTAWRPERSTWRGYIPAMVVAGVVPLVFGLASYYAINGVYRGRESELSEQVAEARPATASLRRAVPAWQALVPTLLSRAGVDPTAQLAESEISTRLTTTAVPDTGETNESPKASGARLVGTNLRFASAERAFLALADLRNTDLLGADLWSADLRGANIAGTSFVGALLFGTDFRKARGNSTPTAERTDAVSADTLYCQRTMFAAANLRYARMQGADLRGASFDNALLQGATFSRSRLQRATFYGADLDGADFRGAIGITAPQILEAHHRGALFGDSLLAELKREAPGDSDLAHYDVAAIQREVDAERASGEAEPDTLSSDAKRARDSTVRLAFEAGAPTAPSSSAIDRWRSTAGKSIPYGCLQSGAKRHK